MSGHVALQLARWKGARVIATASGKNEALLRDLGVDDFIDYTKAKPEDVVRDADLVVDAVGGAHDGPLPSHAQTGRCSVPDLPLGFTGAEEAKKQGFTVSSTQVQSSGAQLAEIGRLLDAGTVRFVIDSTFSLADAWKAHHAEHGHPQGKIVLTVKGDTEGLVSISRLVY